MTKFRVSAIPVGLGFVLASSLIPNIVSAGDQDSVTTKSRIEVDKDDDTTVTKKTQTTVRGKDDGDTTVTKSTKKTVRGKDVDAEDVEEED